MPRTGGAIGAGDLDDIAHLQRLKAILGLSGDWRHLTLEAPLTTMAVAAVSARRPLIVPVFDNEPAELAQLIGLWRECGASSLLLGSDKIIVADATAR